MKHKSRFLVPICIMAVIVILAITFSFINISPRERERGDHYDFIVVGGGAAGCRAAQLLSENHHHRVLLIEAGPDLDDDARISIISPATNTLLSDNYNELFWPVSQVKPEVVPNQCNRHMTGGRIFGGSSSINGVQSVVGTDWMRNRWVQLTGESMWDTASVLDSIRDIENYNNLYGTASAHGDDGDLLVQEQFIVSPQTTVPPMAEKLVKSLEQLTGQSRLSDYNNLQPGSRVGPFTRWQLTMSPNNTRSSASRSFLTADVKARPNLHIELHATVLRVLINRHKHAYGVTYLKNGQYHHVYARRKIQLCAGVFSPTILQHSGIGDGAHLTSLGYDVVVDNPNVGRNIANHEGIVAVFGKNLSDLPSANPGDLYEGGAWLSSPLNVSDDILDASPRRMQLIGINGYSVMVVVLFNLQPNSTGYVQIRDQDPLRVPANSDNIFDSDGGNIDQTLMAQAVKRYICGMHYEFQGTGHGPAVDTNYFLYTPSVSICNNDQLLYEWVGNNTNAQAHHWTGSCRMGIEGDGISVTNGFGEVHGVTGLVVSDASAVPQSADGNTYRPALIVSDLTTKKILSLL